LRFRIFLVEVVMLARFFIDRPVLAWVISIVIILLGTIAAALLPIAEYPEITPPTVQVTAKYPGANAQVVADTVAAPIEQQVVGVEGMLYMSSQSNNDGSYTLDVTFELGTDVNMAQVLVQNRVAIAEPTLPDVTRAIGVTVKKRSPEILLAVSLYSEDNPETGRPYYDQLYMSNYATIQLKDALARLQGVGDVTDACVAGPGQAASAEPDGRRRDPGVARAERAGGGRADRPAAGA
jgi:multidrug efflux pump subunit AcrB